MKNLLLIFLTIMIMNSCDKDDHKTLLEQLPVATTTGANTAGCLVDGNVFLPKGYFPDGNLSCNYINGKDFNISIAQKNNSETLSMNVISYNQSLSVGETYQLKEYGSGSKFGEYNIYTSTTDNRYRTNSLVTGELKITYHNFEKAILSGTFWFDAVNSDGKIIKIREGRFDMHY